jgi:hypothetical protein
MRNLVSAMVFASALVAPGMSFAAKAADPAPTVKNAEAIQTALEGVVSVQGADRSAAVLTNYYLTGADSSKRFRKKVNTGVWLFNTYTLAALGLGFHPDNAYISALGANAITGYGGVRDPGGEDAWIKAVERTNCVTSNLAAAAQAEAYDNASIGLALADTLRAVRSAYLSIYLLYRRDTAQVALKPADLPQVQKMSLTLKTANSGEETALLAALATSKTAIIACGTPSK